MFYKDEFKNAALLTMFLTLDLKPLNFYEKQVQLYVF